MRAENAAFQARLAALPPVPADSPAGEFVLAEQARERELLAEADQHQRDAAERARTNPLEKTVLVRIRTALEREGCCTHRMTSAFVRGDRPMTVGEPGMPDLLVEVGVQRPGLMFWIEAKTQVGRLSPVQVAWHAKAVQRGQFVFVARTADDALAHYRHVLSVTR